MYQNCIVCGKQAHSKGRERKYCSFKCYYKVKNQHYLARKIKRWETSKDKIIEMRRNGYRISVLAKEFELSGKDFLKDKLEELGIRQERNPRSFCKVPINLEPSEDLFYVCGVIYGDGWIRNEKHHQCKNSRMCQIGLDVADKDFALAFSRSCKKIGLNPSVWKQNKEGWTQGYAWRVLSTSMIFVDWFESIKYDFFLDADEKLQIPFIRGVFDSDGSSTSRPNITAKKEDFILFMKEIIENIGFSVNLKYYEKWDFYRIYINGDKNEQGRFLEVIIPEIKRKRWIA